MTKRAPTSEEIEAYKARLSQWRPCVACHYLCEATWIFWCCGTVVAAWLFLSSGHTTAGGWTLALGIMGMFCFSCSRYVQPPTIPHPDDEEE